MADDLVIPTPRGLYCPPGEFHIDPWCSDGQVDRAIVTHAHADHASPGAKRYLCSAPGAPVLKHRVQPGARIQGLPFGQTTTIRRVTISLHPAGHLLGSAQVRLQHAGQTWAISGDYKVRPDPTCRTFEPVPCDVFITESTFGLPIYTWPDPASVIDQVHDWWADNAAAGRTSIVFAYALGKAQRLIASLDPDRIAGLTSGGGAIAAHGSVMRFVDVYRAAGVAMPEVHPVNDDTRKLVKGRGLVVAPPSVLGTTWLRRFAPNSLAFASGWMAVRGNRRRRSVDRGFVMSDHADWPGLHDAIAATGATRVGVTHGYTEAMVRYLRDHGTDAFTVPTRYVGESEEATPAPGSADDNPSDRSAAPPTHDRPARPPEPPGASPTNLFTPTPV